MEPPNHLVQGLRPFLPAKDFETSLRFYRALGCTEVWTSDSLVHFEAFGFGFFVQRYYVKEWADNTMVDLRVADVDQFWAYVEGLHLTDQFMAPVKLAPPSVDENNIKRGAFIDPAGVLWHVSEHVGRQS